MFIIFNIVTGKLRTWYMGSSCFISFICKKRIWMLLKSRLMELFNSGFLRAEVGGDIVRKGAGKLVGGEEGGGSQGAGC